MRKIEINDRFYSDIYNLSKQESEEIQVTLEKYFNQGIECQKKLAERDIFIEEMKKEIIRLKANGEEVHFVK